MLTKDRRAPRARKPPASSLRFSLVNIMLMVLGALSITAGYMMLADGSLVGAPLLLVLGYVVLIPLGIIL